MTKTMVTNSIASIIQDTKRDKVTLVLKPEYSMRGLKLSSSEEMCLLTIYSEIMKAKIGRLVEEDDGK